MSFGWAPGPEDSMHLWGNVEYDFNTDDQLNGDPPTPAFFHADCRYKTKRAYTSSSAAEDGARRIRRGVEKNGGTFDTLYPYPCPDGDHWHLSHNEQGERECPRCAKDRPAWKDSRTGEWVIISHGTCPTRAVPA